MTVDQLEQEEFTCSTAPARPKGLKRGLAWARGTASVCLLPIMQRAARSYIGGATIDDALAVAKRFADEGMPSTVSYWNSIGATARQVADEYLASMDRVTASGLDSYLSIKPPALRYSCKLGVEMAAKAQAHGIRLHCDSHGPEVVAPTFAMMQAMLGELAPGLLSTTIPGRWQRSLADVEWAIERGIKVRVVKGEWPDPADPDRDMAAGFLEVIDQLAGRPCHVAVASHNVPLAAEAIARLRAADTSFELELLFGGLPMTQSLAWAQENRAPVRVYIPYGPGYIPYAINQLRRKPRIAWWIIKDLLTIKRRPARAK